MIRAPFAPLTAGASGLDAPPRPDPVLRSRLGEVYGVAPENLLPVAGAVQGLELVVRRARAGGGRTYRRSATDLGKGLPEIYGLTRAGKPRDEVAFCLFGAPGLRLDGTPSLDRITDSAGEGALVVLDETLIEFSGEISATADACTRPDVLVLRDLSFARGLAGAPAGAVIGSAGLIEALSQVMCAQWLPASTARLALQALDPSRSLATESRIAAVKAERERMVQALSSAPLAQRATAGQGPFVAVMAADLPAVQARFARFGVFDRLSESVAPTGALVWVSADPAENDRALAGFGVEVEARPRRIGETVRDTRETRIAVTVDLDGAACAAVHTGVGYFDHMLEQVATHGGFSLTLSCNGDTHIDAHHTIEDCALAFGAALKQALGERRGIARFGFVLPMDETQAKVVIDLGGRPYSVFEGTFSAPLLGEYPTEMTAHVFRSLAESLSAAIHVEVTGENDHHKTEACFKALGRALRQAVRIEGEDLPSTKGVI